MGSPSADMQAGGLNPILEELMRQRRIQQAPMPPAQDPRYAPPMPPMDLSPFPQPDAGPQSPSFMEWLQNKIHRGVLPMYEALDKAALTPEQFQARDPNSDFAQAKRKMESMPDQSVLSRIMQMINQGGVADRSRSPFPNQENRLEFPPGIPGVNGQPMSYPEHPMPQGGMIRGGGMRVDPQRWSDTPGMGHQSNWMEQMRNNVGKNTYAESDLDRRRRFFERLQRQGSNMSEMDLEKLLTQMNEEQAVGTIQDMHNSQQEFLRYQ